MVHKPDTERARTAVLCGIQRQLKHYICIVFHYLDFIIIFVAMVTSLTKSIACTVASMQPGVRGFPANTFPFIIAFYRIVNP